MQLLIVLLSLIIKLHYSSRNWGSHTIGENLIKPSLSAFLKTVLEKDIKDVKAMSLDNNTVSRRIVEMSEDIEIQLVDKLKTRKFAMKMNKSTVRDTEAIFITYISSSISAWQERRKKLGCLQRFQKFSDIFEGNPSSKVSEYKAIVMNMLDKFQALSCSMIVRVQFLHSHKDFSPENFGSVTAEQSESIHQDIKSYGAQISRKNG
ncbi:SCAN domain-containing protein 3 [Nephila pilipes]|uniref:SCAN domain-containing protein 3 n=1 Tax=Nephila pilipes TaxID=299642 RepID=A0A8X6MBT7_NEPPI|nr:SCAN domain-containing protein 3 [Nephila pilipes]